MRRNAARERAIRRTCWPDVTAEVVIKEPRPMGRTSQILHSIWTGPGIAFHGFPRGLCTRHQSGHLQSPRTWPRVSHRPAACMPTISVAIEHEGIPVANRTNYVLKQR